MTKKTYKVRTKNKTVTLTDREFIAAGGQGTVFKLGDLAYKIYHDPKKVIPEAKIIELAELKHDNILAPIEPLYDMKNIPIGFTMKYIQEVEFLCQIFTRNFRDAKGISPTDIAELVIQMQKTLQYIHSRGVLVVDYNEMNFLLDKMIKTVFHIDVDSWKTKNFSAVAIMDSIRDRKGPPGVFTELTDWFSWAIVTFQMYIGIHPYKGRIDDYKPAEWLKRMDDNVSIFEPGVKLPPACQDFSVIPKKHLEWYKAVFKKGERSVPPLPDDLLLGTAVVRTVMSMGDFIVKCISEVNEPIRNVFYFNGKRYILTRKGFYYRDNLVIKFRNSMRSTLIGMCDVFNKDPLIVYHKNNKVNFYDLSENLISSIEAEDMMGYHSALYTINNGQLIQNTFERLGRIIHKTKIVCNITNSYKVFKGVIFLDDFMKCRLVIPFEADSCVNICVKELDNHRIISAGYDQNICICISEFQGKYYKAIICFNKLHSEYEILQEGIDFQATNFIVLPNKLCLDIDLEKLSLFKTLTTKKEIRNIPFDNSMRLYNENMQVMFIDENKLYSVSMK